jgi:tetraacyldisaccharide 4'-kinase
MRLAERIWWRRDETLLARALLSPLLVAEGLFRAGVGARGALYDLGVASVARSPVPVVSVGNLAVGGAGKTPAAIAIGARLAAAGRTVAVLSRGYGARRSDERVVSDGRSLLLGAAEGGDEPVLVARRLPGARVLCGPRRAVLARRAVEDLGADVLLLDDGFQHRALARDLDVAVLDASNPFGNGHCLPRGPNREPRSALRRAGLVWLARVDEAAPGDPEPERLRQQALRLTGRPPLESRHAPRDVLDGALSRSLGLAWLAGRRVLLLSGVAKPESFRRTAAGLGAVVAAERAYPDHHPFSEADLDEALATAGREGCEAVLLTEKDAVRLSPEQARDARLRVLRIEAEIVAGAASLDAALEECLSR